MKVVISQPMYFPWIGLLEQIRLADTFVYYDDVQFTRGFFNRVEIKSENGARWITVPLKKHPREAHINEVLTDESKPWRELHRKELAQCYRTAPYVRDMLEVVDAAYSKSANNLADVARESTMALTKYFGLGRGRRFITSSALQVQGHSTGRLLAICRALGASEYITGHGAANYLDHALFDGGHIEVRYMDYRELPYLQLHGKFTPYVSALDLVANCGKDGLRYICSQTVTWKEFIDGRN